MITPEQWDNLSAYEKHAMCMNELADALEEADKSLRIQPFNEETRILEGATTLIMRRDDVIATA